MTFWECTRNYYYQAKEITAKAVKILMVGITISSVVLLLIYVSMKDAEHKQKADIVNTFATIDDMKFYQRKDSKLCFGVIPLQPKQYVYVPCDKVKDKLVKR